MWTLWLQFANSLEFGHFHNAVMIAFLGSSNPLKSFEPYNKKDHQGKQDSTYHPGKVSTQVNTQHTVGLDQARCEAANQNIREDK